MSGDIHPTDSGGFTVVSVAALGTVLLAALVVPAAVQAQPNPPAYDPRTAFQEADTNHDGAVDHAEFVTRMTEVFFFADTDKDGVLSAAEAPATLVQTSNPSAADSNHDGQMTVHTFLHARMQDYEQADTNDDGLLELDEVVDAYQPQTK
jgi:EF hand